MTEVLLRLTSKGFETASLEGGQGQRGRSGKEKPRGVGGPAKPYRKNWGAGEGGTVAGGSASRRTGSGDNTKGPGKSIVAKPSGGNKTEEEGST